MGVPPCRKKNKETPKNYFFKRLYYGASFLVFLGISKYLIEKYFDIVWVYQSPGTSKWTTEKSLF